MACEQCDHPGTSELFPVCLMVSLKVVDPNKNGLHFHGGTRHQLIFPCLFGFTPPPLIMKKNNVDPNKDWRHFHVTGFSPFAPAAPISKLACSKRLAGFEDHVKLVRHIDGRRWTFEVRDSTKGFSSKDGLFDRSN